MTDGIGQDATLKRCFGKDEKIADCTWEYISQQRTLAAPHEPMPRLRDLLEFLASPGLENVWLLLDIKVQYYPSHPFHTAPKNLLARQRRRQRHAPHRGNHSIRRPKPPQTLESAPSPRVLGRQVPPSVRGIPARLPHNAHRFLHTVRAPIPLDSERLLQYAAKDPHGAILWSALHPRRESEREAVVRVDGQRGRHDEMEY